MREITYDREGICDEASASGCLVSKKCERAAAADCQRVNMMRTAGGHIPCTYAVGAMRFLASRHEGLKSKVRGRAGGQVDLGRKMASVSTQVETQIAAQRVQQI